MYLNRQIVLGVNALIHLSQPGRPALTRERMAGALGVSSGVAGLVLWKLRLSGLVRADESTPRRFRLAGKPEQITLVDIFDLMDDERPWRRRQRPAGAGALGRIDGPDMVWSGAEACLRLFLSDMTLADLALGASRFDPVSLRAFRRAGGLPDWSAEP